MNVSLNPKAMWAVSSTTKTLLFTNFNFNFHFHFHKHNHSHFTLPLLLMSNPKTARVSTSSSPSSTPHASLKRVGTHNGSFHCDEALGCFMIRLTRKFFNAEIIRTRDPQVSFLSPLFLSLVWEILFIFYFFICFLVCYCAEKVWYFLFFDMEVWFYWSLVHEKIWYILVWLLCNYNTLVFVRLLSLCLV